jgi:hypothetical protein
MAKTESMRVFLAACDTLAAVLTPHGFTYRKSKREVWRQGALFEHYVNFSTSRSINSLPGHVHLEVWAMAWSTALAEYRRQAGIELPTNEACLFAIDIENIFRPAPPYVRYDVGDPETRGEILVRIAEVLRTEVLRTEVLRVFELVESPSALRESIQARELPCFSPEAVRDYFTYFGTEHLGAEPSVAPDRHDG